MTNQGIWKYQTINNSIQPNFRITLNEGGTPLYKTEIEDQTIFLKDENKNPTGSFKDRSLAYQISYYLQKKNKYFVISSSGNAAKSAIGYISLYKDLKLKIFLSNKIKEHKLKAIEFQISKSKFQNIEIKKSEKPKSDAIKFAKNNDYINLRGSTDDIALVGYKTIAYEIVEQLPDADSIFICTSSGTSTQGIYEGYKEMFEQKIINKIPQLHIIQSSKVHPIAEKFDKEFVQSNESLADAIVDRVAKRKNHILRIIKETKGSGWIVSDESILQVKKILLEKGYDYEGYNSFVSLAGMRKARKKGWEFQKPVCLMSGL